MVSLPVLCRYQKIIKKCLQNTMSAVLFVIIATFGGALFGIFGGLVGFTVSGITTVFIVLGYLIYYAIVMGIAGGVGGLISSKK